MSIPDVPDIRAAFKQGRDDVYKAAELLLPYRASELTDNAHAFLKSLSMEERINTLIHAYILVIEDVPFEELENYDVMVDGFLNKREYQQLPPDQILQVSAQAAGRLITLGLISKTVAEIPQDVAYHPGFVVKRSELQKAFENIAADCAKIYKDDNGVPKLLTPESLVSMAQTMRP